MRTHETREQTSFVLVHQGSMFELSFIMFDMLCVILTSVDCMNTSNLNMLIMKMCANVCLTNKKSKK